MDSDQVGKGDSWNRDGGDSEGRGTFIGTFIGCRLRCAESAESLPDSHLSRSTYHLAIGSGVRPALGCQLCPDPRQPLRLFLLCRCDLSSNQYLLSQALFPELPLSAVAVGSLEKPQSQGCEGQ